MKEAPDPTQPIVVVFENRGRYRSVPKLDNLALVDRLPLRGSSREVFRRVVELANESGKSISREQLLQFILDAEEKEFKADPDTARQNIAYIKHRFESLTKAEGQLVTDWKTGSVVPVAVEYRGKNYPVSRLSELRDVLEKERFRELRRMPFLFQGEYLYRAVLDSEWKQIENDGAFLVKVRTNFESSVGPQVKMYATHEGYAGKVIRIKVRGPYFRHAGMQVPRVESFVPHFAPVEVLKGDEWLALSKPANLSGDSSECTDPLARL